MSRKYEPGLYKFVVIGTYDVHKAVHHRELRIFDHNLTHKSQVKDGEKATSAGTIGVFIGVSATYWKIIDHYSITLRVGFDYSVVPMLTKALEIPYKSEY